MANFQQSTIQYKDYVAQSPIEAMTMVGVGREQELKAGIQKVNDYYSKIAGVDIANDTQKQYLQSSLSSLKGGVAKSLSGDYSDSRIVNQITGAASQIAKDPIIQNAVTSTSTLRKGYAELEEYKKSGKYSAAQEYVYNDAASKYINSVDPEASFNSKPKQYSDYKKRAVEGLKALTGNKNITDDAFYEKDGKLIMRNETIRKELSGISPQQIQQMLVNYLTPEDFDQISAEGRYNYSNKKDEDFAFELQKSYKEKHTIASGYIQLLESQKTKTKDTETIANIDRQIAGEQSRLKSIEEEYDNITISGDIESAKAQKATFDFIHGFSNSFAYENKSTTYQGKTPQESMMWREEFKQKTNQFYDRLNFDIAKDARDYEQKERLEKAKKEGLVVNAGGWLLPRDQDNLPVINENVVEERIIQDGIDLGKQKNDFITQSEILNLVPKGMNKEDWYNSQKTSWALNPTNVDSKVSEYFNRVFKQERRAGAMQSSLSETKKEADQKFGINQFIPKGNNVTFSNNKESYTYTPKDFVTIINKFKDFTKTEVTPSIGGVGGGGGTRTVVDWEKAKRELTSPKEYFLFEKAQAGDKAITPYVENYTKAVILPFNKQLKERENFINTQLKNKLLSTQEGQYTIPSTNQEEQRQAGSLIMGFAEYAKRFGGALPNGTEYDEAKAKALAADPKTFYDITINSGTTFDPSAYTLVASNGKDRVVIPMAQEQKRRLLGTQFENMGDVEFDRDYGEALAMGGGITTAINNRNYVVTKDFNNLQNFGTVGNVIKIGENFQFDLNVRNPIDNSIKSVKFPSQPVPKDKLIEARNRLTDDILFEAMFGAAPTDSDKKILREKAKTNTSN